MTETSGTPTTVEVAPGARGSRARWALDALRRPTVRTDLIQVGKTVVATVGAWFLAVELLGSTQPFLAPWAALLTVHATVYRSFWRGAQSVVATLVGICLSFVAVSVLGGGALTLGLAVLAGLLVARTPLMREEGVTAATTTIFVLTVGTGTDEFLLADRVLDTLLGVAVGILVNVVVFPPLDDRVLEETLDRVNVRLGSLLQRIAEDLAGPVDRAHAQEWIEETRSMDAELDRAETMLGFAWEARRWNPRRRRSRRGSDPETGHQLLVRLEEGVAQARTICRTIDESVTAAHTWEDRFLRPWLELVARTGDRIVDPDANVAGLHEEVDELTGRLSDTDLPGLMWPLYGALITALVNIIDIVDDVVSSHESRKAAAR